MEMQCSGMRKLPVYSQITLEILSKEVRLEAGVDSPEGAAGVAVVPVAGASAAVLLHQVRHLLKLLGIHISVTIEIEHFEGNLEMTKLKSFLETFWSDTEISPP